LKRGAVDREKISRGGETARQQSLQEKALTNAKGEALRERMITQKFSLKLRAEIKNEKKTRLERKTESGEPLLETLLAKIKRQCLWVNRKPPN